MNHAMLNALTDRIISADLDAVGFVPGPNFRCLFGRDFHLMERAFMVLVPKTGPAVAVVPHLEMTSFDTLNFSGTIFAWRDEDGYEAAFAAAAEALAHLGPAPVIGLEAQRMRVFEQFALKQALPQAQFRDAHALISELRLQKTEDEIAKLQKAIEISVGSLSPTINWKSLAKQEFLLALKW